jgi:hypothetical protein
MVHPSTESRVTSACPAATWPRRGAILPRVTARPNLELQDRVFAVLDSSAAADAAGLALIAAGFVDADIERLEGPAAADAFDGTGRAHGIAGRLRRAVQVSLMDQLPDLAWYEAALREGRIVMGVRAPGRDRARLAVDAFVGAGGHFINRFGSLQTEEFVRWQGPEPTVHALLRR